MRGRCAAAADSSAPGAHRIAAGSLSPRMWPSSRSPALGLIGTTGTPASSAPDDGDARLGHRQRPHPHALCPRDLLGHVRGGVAHLRVGQLALREAQGETVGRLAESREEHGLGSFHAMQVAEVSEFGAPEVLHLAERPDPAPGPDEVVVRIRAANVNPTDLATRAGVHSPPGLELPYVPGWDLAGEVTAVGGSVDGFAPGDRVVGMIPFGRIGGRVGAYAQAAGVEPGWLSPLAGDVEDAVAATLPLNALTARQALDIIAAPPGSTLLVTGASGAVGGFATQLAARDGVRVIAQASTDDEEWVASLGAAEVLPRSADLASIDTVDAVLDAVPLGPVVDRAPARRRHGRVHTPARRRRPIGPSLRDRPRDARRGRTARAGARSRRRGSAHARRAHAAARQRRARPRARRGRRAARRSS